MASFAQVSTKGKAQQQVPFKEKGEATGVLGDLIDLMNVGPLTQEASKGVLDIVDTVYDAAVTEDLIAGPLVSDEVAADKRVGAAISEDQGWSDIIMRRVGEDAYTPPNLTKEQELAELEEFAERRGTSVQEVATNPMLYEEFGRYLGKTFNTLSDDKYWRYNEDGSTPENNTKVPTPWVEPQYVSQVMEEDKGFFFENPATSEEEDAYNAGLRVHNTLQETFNPNLYGPGVQGIIAERIVAEGNHSAESLAEFMTSIVTNYAAIAEQNPNAGKAFSDMMFHSVLAQTKKNTWKSVLREKEKDFIGDDLERALRDRSDAMTGIADDEQIGFMILDSMGVEESTEREKSLAGSLARNIVSRTFSHEQADAQGLWSEKLFEIDKDENTSDEGPKTNYFISLTQKGLAFATRLEDLTSLLVPSSVRDVRYEKKTSVERDVIPRKHRGLKGMPHGDLKEKLEFINVQENTPATIHVPALDAVKAIVFNPMAMELLNGIKFLKIKGDGAGSKGVIGRRLGYVLRRNSSGQLLDEAGNVTKDINLAERINDMSDAIKDSALTKELKWAERNKETVNPDGTTSMVPFFYDYFFGVNNRMTVDQTVGNFQHSKLARALLASAVEEYYDLSGSTESKWDVMVLKAGIMKRFGFDKKDVELAAIEFDSHIVSFTKAFADLKGEGGVEVMKMAGEHEGWASIAAMAEAVKFQQVLQSDAKVYSSGFLTEIDGLTNGMAWSAWQSGDIKLAGATNLFSAKDYMVWKKGDTKFDDAYEMLDDQLKENLKWLWSPEGRVKGFKGMISDGRTVGFKGVVVHQTIEAFKTILDGANSQNFRDAMSLIGERGGILGRAFAKKPVMIFGYGAGPARILESVRMFMSDVFIDKPELRDVLLERGIDIEKDFVLPLGVSMAEAVRMKFGIVKELSNVLSTAASLALGQKFILSISTNAGYRVNLGSKNTKIDPNSRMKYSFATGDHKTDQKTGEWKPVNMQSASYLFNKDFNWYASGLDPDSLKAATQITVLLTHANDSININRAMTNIHKELIANSKSEDTVGNTTFQVFDGLYVTPKKAGRYANELNDVFRQINVDSSHVMNVFDSLTFELSNSGQRIIDPVPGTRKPSDVGLSKTKEAMNDQMYKRRLLPDAADHAKSNGISTWDKSFDKDAFDWNTPDETNEQGRFKIGTKSLREKLFLIEEHRKQMDKDITNIMQFFWDKSRSKYAR
jgi:hypothetical protein